MLHIEEFQHIWVCSYYFIFTLVILGLLLDFWFGIISELVQKPSFFLAIVLFTHCDNHANYYHFNRNSSLKFCFYQSFSHNDFAIFYFQKAQFRAGHWKRKSELFRFRKSHIYAKEDTSHVLYVTHLFEVMHFPIWIKLKSFKK